MADQPDDDEPETFVQKAVKIGLVTIPLMMYVSWAYKKFVPCPRVKTPRARTSLFRKTATKGKRKNKKGKCQGPHLAKEGIESCEDLCQGSKSAKQAYKREEICDDPIQDSRSLKKEICHQNQLSWFGEMNEKDMEPTKEDYMEYLKHSTRNCCESVTKDVKERQCSVKDSEHEPNEGKQTQKSNDTCSEQPKEEIRQANKTCPESDTQSDSITPEAFDKLFEQHFQQCVEDFKQHQKRLKEEIERLKDDCKTEQTERLHETSKKGNYLECLVDLNLDKDFGCDPNFHSKDSNTPYVVKDYNCKPTRGTLSKSHQNEQSKNGYLKCLADLNMDKQILEEKQEPQSYEEKIVNDECCPTQQVKDSYKTTQKEMNECSNTSQYKSEELCETGKSNKEHTEVNNIKRKVNSDDCGCDPHTNTKETGKYGRVKGEPCDYKSEKEDETDDDALKDFWHACGPPKGLRRGCRGNKPSPL